MTDAPRIPGSVTSQDAQASSRMLDSEDTLSTRDTVAHTEDLFGQCSVSTHSYSTRLSARFHHDPSVSSLPSLVACSHGEGYCELCTVAGSSLQSGLASAVSGIPLFDEQGDILRDLDNVAYECPFNFLNCMHVYTDREAWDDHCLSHFRAIGPPVNGSRCPLCESQFSPGQLSPGTKMNPTEISNSRRQAKLQIKERALPPSRRETAISPGTAGVPLHQFRSEAQRRQALALWKLRQDHLASHMELGYSMAAATPDFALFKYLRDMELISDVTYKDLYGDPSGRTGQGAASIAEGKRSERASRVV